MLIDNKNIKPKNYKHFLDRVLKRFHLPKHRILQVSRQNYASLIEIELLRPDRNFLLNQHFGIDNTENIQDKLLKYKSILKNLRSKEDICIPTKPYTSVDTPQAVKSKTKKLNTTKPKLSHANKPYDTNCIINKILKIQSPDIKVEDKLLWEVVTGFDENKVFLNIYDNKSDSKKPENEPLYWEVIQDELPHSKNVDNQNSTSKGKDQDEQLFQQVVIGQDKHRPSPKNQNKQNTFQKSIEASDNNEQGNKNSASEYFKNKKVYPVSKFQINDAVNHPLIRSLPVVGQNENTEDINNHPNIEQNEIRHIVEQQYITADAVPLSYHGYYNFDTTTKFEDTIKQGLIYYSIHSSKNHETQGISLRFVCIYNTNQIFGRFDYTTNRSRQFPGSNIHGAIGNTELNNGIAVYNRANTKDNIILIQYSLIENLINCFGVGTFETSKLPYQLLGLFETLKGFFNLINKMEMEITHFIQVFSGDHIPLTTSVLVYQKLDVENHFKPSLSWDVTVGGGDVSLNNKDYQNSQLFQQVTIPYSGHTLNTKGINSTALIHVPKKTGDQKILLKIIDLQKNNWQEWKTNDIKNTTIVYYLPLDCLNIDYLETPSTYTFSIPQVFIYNKCLPILQDTNTSFTGLLPYNALWYDIVCHVGFKVVNEQCLLEKEEGGQNTQLSVLHFPTCPVLPSDNSKLENGEGKQGEDNKEKIEKGIEEEVKKCPKFTQSLIQELFTRVIDWNARKKFQFFDRNLDALRKLKKELESEKDWIEADLKGTRLLKSNINAQLEELNNEMRDIERREGDIQNQKNETTFKIEQCKKRISNLLKEEAKIREKIENALEEEERVENKSRSIFPSLSLFGSCSNRSSEKKEKKEDEYKEMVKQYREYKKEIDKKNQLMLTHYKENQELDQALNLIIHCRTNIEQKKDYNNEELGKVVTKEKKRQKQMKNLVGELGSVQKEIDKIQILNIKIELYNLASTGSFFMDHRDSLIWFFDLPFNCWYDGCNSKGHSVIRPWINKLYENHYNTMLHLDFWLRVDLGGIMSWITSNPYFITNEILKSDWVKESTLYTANTFSKHTGYNTMQVNNTLKLIVGIIPYIATYYQGVISFPQLSGLAISVCIQSQISKEKAMIVDLGMSVIPGVAIVTKSALLIAAGASTLTTTGLVLTSVLAIITIADKATNLYNYIYYEQHSNENATEFLFRSDQSIMSFFDDG